MLKKFIFVILLLEISKSGHVCSEDELIRELREDLEDNGTN